MITYTEGYLLGPLTINAYDSLLTCYLYRHIFTGTLDY